MKILLRDKIWKKKMESKIENYQVIRVDIRRGIEKKNWKIEIGTEGFVPLGYRLGWLYINDLLTLFTSTLEFPINARSPVGFALCATNFSN